jgi:hypothetical protein
MDDGDADLPLSQDKIVKTLLVESGAQSTLNILTQSTEFCISEEVAV